MDHHPSFAEPERHSVGRDLRGLPSPSFYYVLPFPKVFNPLLKAQVMGVPHSSLADL